MSSTVHIKVSGASAASDDRVNKLQNEAVNHLGAHESAQFKRIAPKTGQAPRAVRAKLEDEEESLLENGLKEEEPILVSQASSSVVNAIASEDGSEAASAMLKVSEAGAASSSAASGQVAATSSASAASVASGSSSWMPMTTLGIGTAAALSGGGNSGEEPVPNAPTINPVAGDNTLNAVEARAGTTITGTKEAGALVTLTWGNLTRTIAADGASTWSYTLTADDITAMGQGTETIRATQTNAAGNVSVAVATRDITIDTTVPSTPTISNPIAGDNTLNAAEAGTGTTLTGTKEAGALVTLTWGGLTRTIAADGLTTWSYTLTADDITAMGQGTEILRATQTDAAGNTSAIATRVIAIDTTVPNVPTINPVAGDNTLNAVEAGAGTTITGTKEAGALVTLTWGSLTHTIAADGASTWSYTLTADDITAMGQGAETIRATQTDAAGNTSATATRDITIDTIAPSAPSLTLDPLNDSGTSNSDGVTDALGATVTVAGLEAGATWRYQVDNGSWSQWYSDTANTFNLSTAEGTYVYRVQQKDDLGNISDTSQTTYTLDTTGVATQTPYTPIDLEGPVVGIGNNYTEGDAYQYVAAVGTGGSFVVAWHGAEEDANGVVRGSVYVQQYNADGTTTGYPRVTLKASLGGDEEPIITAIGTQGAYVVTWHSDYIAYVQRFNADGSEAGTPTQLSVPLTNYADNSSNHYPISTAAVGTQGDYVVAWNGQDGQSPDYTSDIFVQKFRADGSSVNTPIEIHGTNQQTAIESGVYSPNANQDYPPRVIAIGTEGRFVVTWFGSDAGPNGANSIGGDHSIFMQQFNADGAIVGGDPVKLEAPGVSNLRDWFPQITTIGTEGDYVVAWKGETSANVFSYFVQRFHSDGSPNGATVPLSGGATTSSGTSPGIVFAPTITAIGTLGAFVVAWQGYDSGTDSSTLYVQQYNADGSSATSARPFALLKTGTFEPNLTASPQVTAIGSDGDYVVVWKYTDGNTGPISYGYPAIFVYAQQFNADGTPISSAPVLLGTYSWYASLPQVTAIGTKGDYAVSWVGIDSNTSTADATVHVQRFNADGEMIDDLIDIQVADGGDKWLDPGEAVTLEVSYVGMAVGDIIDIKESGQSVMNSNLYTVTLNDVDAGKVSVVVSETSLGAGVDGKHTLKATITDLAGNVSIESPVGITLTTSHGTNIGPNSISLGAGDGQLINGINVDGQWYYQWDVDGSGGALTGADRVSMNSIAESFLGTGHTGADITTTNNSFTLLNGVRLELIEFSEVQEIWGDVFNPLPPLTWNLTSTNDDYWLANPSLQNEHEFARMFNTNLNSGSDPNSALHYVAFQVI